MKELNGYEIEYAVLMPCVIEPSAKLDKNLLVVGHSTYN